MSIFRHNRKMSQSELSSVGSESPGNSGRDERGSLIGERGRSTHRHRNINRAASKGKGSSIGKKDIGDSGEKRRRPRRRIFAARNLRRLVPNQNGAEEKGARKKGRKGKRRR